MADISTEYMGLRLQSPVIAAASTLTKDIDNIKRIADAGAGAVVLKSLFEEEIRQESGLDTGDMSHSEAYDYINADAAMVYGAGEYLEYVRKAASASSIPIIASVNCTGWSWWADFASQIEEAGADAIELNISFVPFESAVTADGAERLYTEVIKAVKSRIGIPVGVKIGHGFTSIPNMVQKIRDAGADGVTMFNRYYQMRINSRTLDFEPVHTFSRTEEAYDVIRWIAAVHGQNNIDISACTGLHNEDILIQFILAGAKTAQTASLLYQNGFSAITDLNAGLSKWLDKKNVSSVLEAVGMAVRRDAQQHQAMERLQYIKVADGSLIQ